MFELNAVSFLEATKRLFQASEYIKTVGSPSQSEPLLKTTELHIISLVENILSPIYTCGAKSAWVSAERLLARLRDNDPSLTFGKVGECLSDIESRFSDHLNFVKLYVVPDDRSHLMAGARNLFGDDTLSKFVSISFDCEEAAKCLCLGRATASVFHSMRMLEIAIKALSKRLGIDDPAKPAERNWGIMLKKIKDRIDEVYPVSARHSNSEGSFFEGIYASLDAVKNPWRNRAMHVDTVYTIEESQHIFNCTKSLLVIMSTGFNEEGIDTHQDSLEAFLHVSAVEHPSQLPK